MYPNNLHMPQIATEIRQYETTTRVQLNANPKFNVSDLQVNKNQKTLNIPIDIQMLKVKFVSWAKKRSNELIFYP